MLDIQVGAGGKNLSAGERQLIGFARTLLRKNKLVVMDEPTSNIDIATDEIIQKVVRSAYPGASMITIAHRLNTVIDSDKLLVMEAGKVLEFDRPGALLDRPGSHLAQLAPPRNSTSQALSKKMLADPSMDVHRDLKWTPNPSKTLSN